MTGTSLGFVNSSEREQILYKLLEEHVALKGELGRLRKLLKNSGKGDSEVNQGGHTSGNSWKSHGKFC